MKTTDVEGTADLKLVLQCKSSNQHYSCNILNQNQCSNFGIRQNPEFLEYKGKNNELKGTVLQTVLDH